MKKLLALLFLSFTAIADQGEVISMARDYHLKGAIEKLSAFCEKRRPDLPKDTQYLYLCLLQARADCSHGENAEKITGCKTINLVESLEKKVLVTDQHLSTLTKIPIGSNLPKKTNSKSLKSQLVEAHRILLSAPMNRECKKDDDCKLIFYGPGGCIRDHQGYFAGNTGSQPQEFESALSEYNSIKRKLDAESKEGYLCTFMIRNYKAVCRTNVCEGIELGY